MITGSPFAGCSTFASCVHDSQGVDDKPTDDAAALDMGGACSFSSKTRVTTEQGKQAIDHLHPGERVLAYNPHTHKMELQPILHVWIHTDNDLVDVTITTTIRSHFSHLGTESTQTSEVIHTNRKHPFFTLEYGFLAVSRISLGMHILRADGSFGVVTGWKMVPGTQVMYNLEVAQDHTFTVGDGQWVVHNCGPSIPENPSIIGHIFQPDHNIEDTPENRLLLINTASDDNNNIGTDIRGNTWYAKDLPDGRQVWVLVRNNQIRNGGINDTPRPWDPNTGFSSPTPPSP